MSKLSRKLILQITLVLCIVFVLSFAIHTYFLPKYFLYQKKQKLATLATQMSQMEYAQAIKQSDAMETEYQVTIVSASLSDTIDVLNEQLKSRLSSKGIALSKFWLTEDRVQSLRNGGRVNVLYDQDKMKSSYLVNFVPVEGHVFAIGESISHSSETIRIVNQFDVYIWLGALLLLILLSAIYTTRIVKPLGKLHDTAEAISNLSFAKVDIQTGDEIESLAHSINRMSDNLQEAHRSLEVKNENLRTFIADISHELKTPLTLIQIYASGMRDGLDDGSYAEVIRQQSEEMAIMIERLLELSRLQVEPYCMQPLDFRSMFQEVLPAYQKAFHQQALILEVDDRLHHEAWVMADRKKLQSVLHNYITNAMKYTTNNRVKVEVVRAKNDDIRFSIANESDSVDREKWESVWEPFFVLESSRSKKFSGTGLGLSIVKTILQKHNARFGLQVQEGTVEFYFELPALHHRVE